MPAYAGDPWRGAAKIHRAGALGGAHTYAWVTVGLVEPTGNVADAEWEGSPGSALTLTFQWRTESAGAGQSPNFANVQMFLPELGTSVGATTWNITPFPFTNTPVTRTFHFDDDPLSGALSAALRAGMLEIVLTFGSTGGIAPWSLNSRGASSGTSTDPLEWARGKVRAGRRIQQASFSNVALAGAEPALFAAGDPFHGRITAAQWYEAVSHTLSLRRPDNGVAERSQAASTAGPDFDVSWTASDGGLTSRIAPLNMAAASEAKDLRLDIASSQFGGDEKRVWDTAGHLVGWVRDSELSIRHADRLVVDPRRHIAAGGVNSFHFQRNRASFDTSYHEAAKQMLQGDIGKAAAIVLNARDEGLNGLSYTLEAVGDANAASSVSVSGATATLDGQAGCTALVEICPTGKPAGQWSLSLDITAPADMAPSADIINPTDTVVVIADDPTLALRVEGGDPATPTDHWISGRQYVVGITLIRIEGTGTGTNATRLPMDADSPKFLVASFNNALARIETLAADGVTWEYTVTPHLFSAAPSPGDALTALYTFAGALTAQWGDRGSVFVQGYATYNRVPKQGGAKTDQLGVAFKHSLSVAGLQYLFKRLSDGRQVAKSA